MSNFETFKDILPKLLGYKNFIDYLYEQRFQTIQLQNKQTLKSNSFVLNDMIVRIADQNCSYIDEYFYRKEMKEDKNHEMSSYPVDMHLIEIGWMFAGNTGHRFLSELQKQENLDIYDVELVQCIIVYLFNKFKWVFFTILLPAYMVICLIFVWTIIKHEERVYANQKVIKAKLLAATTGNTSDLEFESNDNILGGVNLFCSLLMIVQAGL